MKVQNCSNQRGIFDPGRPVSTVLGLAMMFSASQASVAADTGRGVAASVAAAASSVADKASSAVSRVGQTSYTGMPDNMHWEHTHRISRILGTNVLNRHGDKVGDVKDVVLDNNGAIAYVIVSTGGFLGVGDRLHAVPWSALDSRGKKDFFIDIDKASLQKAPSFTSHEWPNFADEQWLSNNRRFYHDWVDKK